MKRKTTFTNPTLIGNIFQNKDAYKCKNICNDTKNCVGFLFDNKNNSCQLVSEFINKDDPTIQIDSSENIDIDAYSSNNFM